MRISCAACGLVRDGRWSGLANAEINLVEVESGPHLWRLRDDSRTVWPTEMMRSHRLWLRTECCGHTLWATNEAHLDYLERFIRARLREHWHHHPARPLSWRLPTWMQEAKHRDEVLRGLERMRSRLDEAG
jgi:hypothetical protein